MRILFDALSLGARPSGTRTRLLGLVPALLRQREVVVGILAGPGLSAAERSALAGAQVLDVDRPPRGPRARWMFQLRHYRRLAGTFRPDLTVVDCLPAPRIAPRAFVVHDLRHVVDRTFAGRAASRVLGAALAGSAVIQAVSATVAGQLRALHPGLPPARISVVPNGVDLDLMSPSGGARDAAVRAAHGLTGRYVLVVGHLDPRKDPRTAVGVAELLAQQRIDVPVVFVGQGDLLVEELLVGLRAAYPGMRIGTVLRGVGREELPALYRGAAALLAPSTLEGFGLAPLEAAACGVPVVASDIPAHREVLGDGARYAPPGEEDAFLDGALEALAGGPEVLARRACGIDAASRYGWDAAAAAFRRSLAEAGVPVGAG